MGWNELDTLNIGTVIHRSGEGTSSYVFATHKDPVEVGILGVCGPLGIDYQPDRRNEWLQVEAHGQVKGSYIGKEGPMFLFDSYAGYVVMDNVDALQAEFGGVSLDCTVEKVRAFRIEMNTNCGWNDKPYPFPGSMFDSIYTLGSNRVGIADKILEKEGRSSKLAYLNDNNRAIIEYEKNSGHIERVILIADHPPLAT